jgi:hypothetical protein
MKAQVLTFVSVLLVGSPSFAQPPGGGLLGGGFGFLLLTEAGQKELKLSDGQIEKIQAIGQELRDEFGAEFRAAINKPEDQRRELLDRADSEAKRRLSGVLDAAQLKRYEQLQRQMAGVAIYTNEEIQKKLELSPEQVEKLREIARETMQRQREIVRDFRGDRDVLRDKSAALRRGSMARATAVLTEAQKETWNAMIGEPFDLGLLTFERRPRTN